MLVRYEYDVFGAIRSEVGTSENPRKFTGKEYESDVKLYYFAARYYDPYIGRFTSRDPAGDGVNWYIYAFNNPLAFIDPTGLRALSALETDVVNFVFQGTVDPAALDIEEVPGLHGINDDGSIEVQAGLYVGGGNIKVNAEMYARAGLTADSTMANTNILAPAVLRALSTVVHEAAHHWQRKFGRNNTGRAGEYHFSQGELFTILLGSEQHASAAQVYFILAWQIANTGRGEQIDLSTWYKKHRVGPVERYNRTQAIRHQDERRLVTRGTAINLMYDFINFTQALRNAGRQR